MRFPGQKIVCFSASKDVILGPARAAWAEKAFQSQLRSRLRGASFSAAEILRKSSRKMRKTLRNKDRLLAEFHLRHSAKHLLRLAESYGFQLIFIFLGQLLRT